MDQFDLIQIRINLHNYKKFGKEPTISILKQLQLLELAPNSIKQCKIYKSLGSLSKLDQEKDTDQDFNQQDIIFIRDTARMLVRKMKDALKTSEKLEMNSKNHPPDNSTILQDQKVRKDSKDINGDIQELVEELNLPKDFPELRRKVIQRLISVMMDHKENNLVVNQYSGARFALLCRKLEDEASTKYQLNNQYKDIIKEMIKHLQHDDGFTIRLRLLRGLILPSEAILMRSEDWMGYQIT